MYTNEFEDDDSQTKRKYFSTKDLAEKYATAYLREWINDMSDVCFLTANKRERKQLDKYKEYFKNQLIRRDAPLYIVEKITKLVEDIMEYEERTEILITDSAVDDIGKYDIGDEESSSDESTSKVEETQN